MSNTFEGRELFFRYLDDDPKSSSTITGFELETGLCIFLNAKQSEIDEAKFVPILLHFLHAPAFKGLRFLWLNNPNDSSTQWRFGYLPFIKTAEGFVVSKPSFFNFDNLALRIDRDTKVTANQKEVAFERTNDNGFSLTTGHGAEQFSGVGNTVTLSLEGELAGCLQFDLAIYKPPSTENNVQGLFDIPLLDITLRLFFSDQFYPGTDKGYFITSQRYPLLSEREQDWHDHYGSDLTLRATLDPLNHLDQARTYFAFDDDTAALPSCYRTNMGYTIHLTPTDNSGLLFARRPLAHRSESAENGTPDTAAESVDNAETDIQAVATEPPNGPYYLVPYGDFEMTVPSYNGQEETPSTDNLMCGISGLEYIKLDLANSNNLLSFSLGNAFAANFRPATTEKNEDALGDLATTAWAYVRNTATTEPIYYAQPEEAVLYNEVEALVEISTDETGADISDDLLEYMEVPSAVIPKSNGAPFPMLPYGGVFGPVSTDYHPPDLYTDVVRQLEQQVVSPKRREVIRQLNETIKSPNFAPSSSDGETSRTGVTPQGLLATFSADYKTIERTLLAVDTANVPLQFTNIEWDITNPNATALRTALQTAQLFMVVSKPEALQDFFTDNQLTIQGWTFDLDPAPEKWQKHGTILIFKFNDRPFMELVENPSTWAQPGVFNTNQTDIQSKLLGIIEDVLAKDSDEATAKDRENYGKLANAFRNRYWSGILALNVTVSPEGLPDGLRGIAGAIDQDKFYAQYAGIEITPVTVQKTGLVPGQSSLFGLIDYNDNSIPPVTESGYNFQVTRLNARFQNSEMKAFSCDLTLTVDRLFDERTELQGSLSIRNLIVLKGTAERHNDRLTYAFGFSGSNRFALPDSPAIEQVEIIKAQFTTDPGSGNRVTARFSFWGRLYFRQLEGFDILSFGAETSEVTASTQDTSPKYLSFSNLNIGVSFTSSDDLSFSYNQRNLMLDLKRSGVREQSLFAKFPLKFKSFIFSSGDKNINSLGYMPVKSPLDGGRVNQQNWYGLIYDLTLGSLGALSREAGFVVSILAAWSPSAATGSQGVYVGLHMPGSSGGKKEIVLQGLLKLVFKTIEFVVGKDGDNTSYLLRLKNIMLKFFVLSMPPSAQTEIIIFGDPKADPNTPPEDKTLGWYASYAKKPPAS